METVLFSCVGTTDPVRGMHDGGLLHILRHYRPDVVYLFLSDEMKLAEEDVKPDDSEKVRKKKDRRFTKTFAYIREHWQGYAPEVVYEKSNIKDPSDLDSLDEPMYGVMNRIAEKYPHADILINLSSGTPQMKMILANMSLDGRWRAKGIQVKNFENASGTSERTNSKDYPVDEALELNEDDLPGAVNRCSEPKLLAEVRRNRKEQVKALLESRNYVACAQLKGVFSGELTHLIRHLSCRSRLDFKAAEEEAAYFREFPLYPEVDGGFFRRYETCEYFLLLRNLAYSRRYTDFTLRLNPLVVRLQSDIINRELKKQYRMELDDFLTADRARKFDPGKARGKLPVLYNALQSSPRLRGELRLSDLSIRLCNVMLDFLNPGEPVMDILNRFETLNQSERNASAHSLHEVTDPAISECCGCSAAGLVRDLKTLLLNVYPTVPEEYFTVYDRAGAYILENM